MDRKVSKLIVFLLAVLVLAVVSILIILVPEISESKLKYLESLFKILTPIITIFGAFVLIYNNQSTIEAQQKNALLQAKAGSTAKFRHEWATDVRKLISEILVRMDQCKDAKLEGASVAKLRKDITYEIVGHRDAGQLQEKMDCEEKLDVYTKQYYNLVTAEVAYLEEYLSLRDRFSLYLDPDPDKAKDHDLWLKKLTEFESAAQGIDHDYDSDPFTDSPQQTEYKQRRTDFVQYSREQLKQELNRARDLI